MEKNDKKKQALLTGAFHKPQGYLILNPSTSFSEVQQ